MIYCNAVKLFVVASGLLLSLSGCSSLKCLLNPPDWKSDNGAFFGSSPDASDVLGYYATLEGQSDEALDLEYRAVKKRYEADNDELDRWRMIGLRILPGRWFSSPDQALKLLQPPGAAGEARSSEIEGLRKLLVGQQRLLLDMQQQVVAEQERSAALEGQLEELKAIEKILSERERTRLPGSELKK